MRTIIGLGRDEGMIWPSFKGLGKSLGLLMWVIFEVIQGGLGFSLS